MIFQLLSALGFIALPSVLKCFKGFLLDWSQETYLARSWHFFGVSQCNSCSVFRIIVMLKNAFHLFIHYLQTCVHNAIHGCHLPFIWQKNVLQIFVSLVLYSVLKFNQCHWKHLFPHSLCAMSEAFTGLFFNARLFKFTNCAWCYFSRRAATPSVIGSMALFTPPNPWCNCVSDWGSCTRSHLLTLT